MTGYVTEMNLHDYREYIADERLIHLARRGSQRDRVLTVAESFGLQICSFGEMVDDFSSKRLDLASVALLGCQILLKVSHSINMTWNYLLGEYFTDPYYF